MMLFTSDNARLITDESMFGSTPFMTPGRVKTLRGIIANVMANEGHNEGVNLRIENEWVRRTLTYDSGHVPNPLESWIIPGSYDDPAGNEIVTNQIHRDALAGVNLAIRWHVLGDRKDLLACVRILEAWSSVKVIPGESELTWCDKWPMFLQTAMMIRHTPEYTHTLDKKLATLTTNGLALSTAYTSVNNWAAWGVALEISSAVFLGDKERFNTAVNRWRTVIDNAVVNNVPIHEIYRQGAIQGDGTTGIWYSNFMVLALTVAAEWARYAGTWLYDYDTGTGSSFRGLCEQVREWTRHPESYPYNTSGAPSETVRTLAHDYILHALWPHEDSQYLLDTYTNITSRDNFGTSQYVLTYALRPLIG